MDVADAIAKTLREEISLLGPPGPSRRYPLEVKARVVAWAQPLIASGRGKLEVAEALSLPWETVGRWIQEAALARPSAARSAAETLKTVRVVADAPAARLVLRSPKGFTVEGLDVETLVALLARIG